jgi:hypothetical protein
LSSEININNLSQQISLHGAFNNKAIRAFLIKIFVELTRLKTNANLEITASIFIQITKAYHILTANVAIVFA